MTSYQWRLIIHPPADGSWNMAVDESLLESVIAGDSPPVLRLYAWSPPCLSLGYAQPIGDVDLTYLNQQKWSITRRPTGGRAILHTDELTYSVISPIDTPLLHGTILESYQVISKALLMTLQLLGLSATADKQNSQIAGSVQPVCFEVPSNYEITVNHQKVIGSAQARRQNALLQHGTVPLSGDITRIVDAMQFHSAADREAARSRLLEHAATVGMLLGTCPTWDEAAQAMVKAFSQTLDIEFVVSELTQLERDMAIKLAAQKYASPDWINRV
jgi:lipoate-protein ligase A